MALNGSNMPFLVVVTLSRYAPVAVNSIPTIPYLSTFSPNIRYEVNIIKTGVNARNGKVSDKGDLLIAFIYKMSAVVSRGSKKMSARKKWKSNLGILIKNKIINKKGAANPQRTHPMRYSSL